MLTQMSSIISPSVQTISPLTAIMFKSAKTDAEDPFADLVNQTENEEKPSGNSEAATELSTAKSVANRSVYALPMP